MTALLDFTTANSLVLNGLRTRDSSFAATVNRISTGVRLTTMSDDVAAWMVGVRTDNRQRGWNEAGQNIQNGLSLLETADGGAESIYTALSRLRELAVQAATGTYSAAERQAIQGEVETLRQQVFDTVQSTQFNGRKLLAGTSRQDPSTIDLGNLTTLASAPGYTSETQTGLYDVEITQPMRQAALRGNQQAQSLIATDADTTMTLATELGTVSVTLGFTTTPNPSDWVTAINAAGGGIGLSAEITNAATTLDDGVTLVDPAGLGFLMLRSINTGSTAILGVLTNTLVDKFGFSITGASQQRVGCGYARYPQRCRLYGQRTDHHRGARRRRRSWPELYLCRRAAADDAARSGFHRRRSAAGNRDRRDARRAGSAGSPGRVSDQPACPAR